MPEADMEPIIHILYSTPGIGNFESEISGYNCPEKNIRRHVQAKVSPSSESHITPLLLGDVSLS